MPSADIKELLSASNGWVSQTEFTRWTGTSIQNVVTLCRRIPLEKDAKARVRLRPSIVAYFAYLREIAAGRSSADGELDLSKERAKESRARAENLTLSNLEKKGALLPLETLIYHVSRRYADCKAKLRAVPGKAQRVGGLSDEQRRLVGTLVDEALAELASEPLPEGAGEILERDWEDIRSAPGPDSQRVG